MDYNYEGYNQYGQQNSGYGDPSQGQYGQDPNQYGQQGNFGGKLVNVWSHFILVSVKSCIELMGFWNLQCFKNCLSSACHV